MKEVMIITSYFPPETGAASNRIFHLAEGLQKRKFNVSVVTPLPNYPTGKIFDGYKGRFSHKSTEKGISVHRLWIYASNSKNKILRLIAMLSYSFSLVWFFIRNAIPKTAIVQSPPLLVAFTCMLCLKSKKRKLVLNVSDLWPIAGLELGAFKKGWSYRLLEKIERFNYKRADLVLGQSHEILSHVQSIAPQKDTYLYRNYPDFEIGDYEYAITEKRIKIVYAGLLGIAQGIYKLCQELDYEKIEFHIYGSGAEQFKIESFIKENAELPIVYHGHISRSELHTELVKYDLTIIPLLKRIYGSVPSKIFEYAKLGLPMLYFGGGEGEDIIRKHHLGWVAEAGNYNHLNEVLSSIDKSVFEKEMRNNIQDVAKKEFDLNTQLSKLEHKL
ncbi:glycosyltransferase family 4 protein [Psychroserpens sp. XS_ASV72]|uniref:glycosyltransferase family 4 protein n=1 Tax=Psychroserpens sp. XS_ASV72 TaxID=3241293 RepID=UPI003517F734